MRKKKILIIEDEFELCMLLKLHFLENGYEVEMVYNLKDGKERLKTYNPDIVFLDNNLPAALVGTGQQKFQRSILQWE